MFTVHPSFFVGLRVTQMDVALSQLDFWALNCRIVFLKADFFSSYLQNNSKEILKARNENLKEGIVVCNLGP